MDGTEWDLNISSLPDDGKRANRETALYFFQQKEKKTMENFNIHLNSTLPWQNIRLLLRFPSNDLLLLKPV